VGSSVTSRKSGIRVRSCDFPIRWNDVGVPARFTHGTALDLQTVVHHLRHSTAPRRAAQTVQDPCRPRRRSLGQSPDVVGDGGKDWRRSWSAGKRAPSRVCTLTRHAPACHPAPALPLSPEPREAIFIPDGGALRGELRGDAVDEDHVHLRCQDFGKWLEVAERRLARPIHRFWSAIRGKLRNLDHGSADE